METTTPSLLRRLILPLALLVPLIVDPFGVDTLSVERLVLCMLGCVLLGLEAAEGLLARRASLLLATPEALLVALIAWSATSMLWATNPMVGITPVIMLLAILGVARTVRAEVTGTASARGWMVALLTVGVVAMGIDAVAIIRRAPELTADSAKYASFLFEHNNMGANYAVMLIPVAAALLLGDTGIRRVLGIVGLAGGIWYLQLLGSRSGLLFAVGGLPLLFLAFFFRKRLARVRFTGRVAGIALGLIVLVLAVLPFSEQARGLAKDAFYAATRVLQDYGVTNLQDSGFRPDLFKNTVAMAQEAPLHGIGVANWAVEYPRFERHILDRPHTHNDSLRMLSELGIPGLLLFLVFFGSLIMTQLRVLSTARSPGAFACGLGLLGSTLGILFCGLFEVPFTMGSTASVLAVILGLTARLGETGGRAAGSLRPNPLTSLAVIALSTAGLAFVVQRLPASSLVEQSRELHAEGDLDGAARALTDITLMRTGSWVPELELAELDLGRGHNASALLHIRAARKLSPYKTDLMRVEGRVLLALDHFDEAVEAFKEAADAAPGDEDSQSEYIEALAQAGHLPEAIDLLEYKLQSQLRTVNIDAVVRLARYWRLLSEERSGPARVEALVATRHFYAVVLEDGPADYWPDVAPEFKHMTHLLQVIPGSPDSWWPVYERFLTSGGWHRPSTALWTSMDPDGVKLYPGWLEPAGPPLPRELRNLP